MARWLLPPDDVPIASQGVGEAEMIQSVAPASQCKKDQRPPELDGVEIGLQ